MAPSEPRGIRLAEVTDWFVDQIEGVEPPLRFDEIPGGHSNITHAVTDAAGTRYVLRRPPLSSVLATAHDMSREWRVIAALGPTPVPVPPALGFCPDGDVIGAPFYVMGFVDGHVLHTVEIARQVFDAEQRCAAGLSFTEVLAELHSIDPDEVGLAEHGRRENYVGRQLDRWYRQYQQSETGDRPAVDEAHEILSSDVPQQVGATIVHGDYRLGNVLCSHDGPVAAVLDWEISTLGDPLADLGYTLNYWIQADDEDPLDTTQPTMADGFPRREEVVARYAERSGRDVSGIDYYQAFSHWKSACIAQGVYARYLAGAKGDTAHLDLELFDRSVDARAERALLLARRLG